MFAENLVQLGFLKSESYMQSIPTHEKLFAVGKSGPNAAFDLIFLGLRWPWVGEFVGFIIAFTCFPTQQNLVNRKHPLSFAITFTGTCLRLYPLKLYTSLPGIYAGRYACYRPLECSTCRTDHDLDLDHLDPILPLYTSCSGSV